MTSLTHGLPFISGDIESASEGSPARLSGFPFLLDDGLGPEPADRFLGVVIDGMLQAQVPRKHNDLQRICIKFL